MCNSVKPIKLIRINGTDTFVNPSHIIKTERAGNGGDYYEMTFMGDNTLFIEETLELKAYLGIL